MNRNKKLDERLSELASVVDADHEVQMARGELYKIAKYAIKLHELLKNVSEVEGLEAWQQSKITKAADYIGSVFHTLEYDQKVMSPIATEGKTKTMSRAAKGNEKYGKDGMKALAKAGREGANEKELDSIRNKHNKYDDKVDEAAKKGLYYNVNKRKKAGTSRNASSPKAPTAQAWKDAAKTAKKESVAEAYKLQLVQQLDEKAKSKAQQKFMGMVHAAQKGEKPASKEVGKVAKSMSKKSAKDYAATKHKGKPEHVKK